MRKFTKYSKQPVRNIQVTFCYLVVYTIRWLYQSVGKGLTIRKVGWIKYKKLSCKGGYLKKKCYREEVGKNILQSELHCRAYCRSALPSFPRIFLLYLLVFSIKRGKNPEVATFTCGGYERGSSQLKHLLVSVLEQR